MVIYKIKGGLFMALIKCPECGKEISNLSEHCIYCGYPLKANNDSTELYDVIYLGFPNNNIKYKNQIKLCACLMRLLNISLKEAKNIIDNPSSCIFSSIPKEKADWVVATIKPFICNVEIKKSIENIESEKSSILDKYMCNKESTIICPKCGSNQISTGKRGFSLLSGFIGSNKTVNHCSKCGHSWTP